MLAKPTVYLGADHAGWEMKETIEDALQEAGYEVVDLGNQELDEADDYPEFAYKVGQEVAKHPGAFGVLSCGNAEGVCMVANKVRGVRAAVIYSPFAAETSREDDDANVACIPGRVMDMEEGARLVSTFLNTKFSDAERHKRRLAKVEQIESETMK